VHDTCSAADDKAYWDWYNCYCGTSSSSAAAVSSAPYYGASSWEVTSTSVVDGTSTVYVTNVSLP
jgi:hypothetical protein